MNEKSLTYFLEVYNSRNIQAAADKLYMTHQGLSRIIRSFEDELGHPLFVRTNHGLEPTDFAHTIVPHVRRLLEDYATIQGIDSLTSQKKAAVTVYALDHVFGSLGADFFVGFNNAHPEITLSILDTTDEHALEAITTGKCDFAVVNGPVDNTRFNAEELFFARFCFRVNRADPLAQKDTIEPEDMRGRKLIGKGRAYHCFRSNIDRYLFENAISVDVPVETNDEELMQELVERNLAVAATYDFSASSHCGANTVLKYLKDESVGSPICLVEKNGIIPTKAGRAFKKYLLEYIRDKNNAYCLLGKT